MDFELTEEKLMIRNMAREFVEKECPEEYIRQLDEEDRFPAELVEKMVKLGWVGLPIPTEYGGSGGDLMDVALILEQLARRSQALGGAYCFPLMFGSESLLSFGNEEQRMKYLPGVARGEVRLQLAITEPAGGTDILGTMTTMAVPDGSDYIINGQKTFISFADESTGLITVVRTERYPSRKAEGVSIFLVDSKSSGIEMKLQPKLGTHGQHTYEIFFTDVRVPEENLLGKLNHGWYHIVNTLNSERICCAAMSVGTAQGAFEEASAYAKERIAFGKPIGQFQTIQNYLVDMWMQIEAARLVMYRAAWLSSMKKPCGVEATMAKVVASECAFSMVSLGMRILAGVGFMMQAPMQRHFRDSIQHLISPLSNEMSKNVLAQLALGLPRSY